MIVVYRVIIIGTSSLFSISMALLSQFYHNGLFPIKKGPTPKSRKSLSTKYAEGEMEALQVALRGKAWKWTAHAERSLMPLELSRACAHCALNAILHCLCNPLRINTIYWQSIGYTRCIFADVSKCFCLVRFISMCFITILSQWRKTVITQMSDGLLHIIRAEIERITTGVDRKSQPIQKTVQTDYIGHMPSIIFIMIWIKNSGVDGQVGSCCRQ